MMVERKAYVFEVVLIQFMEGGRLNLKGIPQKFQEIKQELDRRGNKWKLLLE